MADASGCFLWADDAFCAVVRRSRARVLGATVAQVLALGLQELTGIALGGGLVRNPTEPGAPSVMVTPLGRRGSPSAFVLHVTGDAGPGPAS
ncbi:MAG TPA: hypothetical protein VGL92_00425, partial [Acidimicrobiia bacterium]